MSNPLQAQVANRRPNKITTHLAVAHNPAFPFSSPTGEDFGSLRSIRTGNTELSQNPVESSNLSTPTLTDCESGATSEQDVWHLERYSESSRTMAGKAPLANLDHKSTNRHGLQIITDFSNSKVQKSSLVVDRVRAKQARTKLNRAKSIISHKGVQVNPDHTLAASPQVGDANWFGGSTHGGRRKRKMTVPSTLILSESNQIASRSQSQKSIVIGMRIPEHEANALQLNDGAEGNNLDVPLTPAIVLTSPDDKFGKPVHDEDMVQKKGIRGRPISSVYTTITCSKDMTEDEEVPPLPSIPRHMRSDMSVLLRQNPFSKQAAAPNMVTSDETERSPLIMSASNEQVPSSCDTPRSQGWWNLLLSPMLSRANSLANKFGQEDVHSPPPMPAVPGNLEKRNIPDTPATNFSPETPRRVGMAQSSSTAWSNWSDWEHQKASVTTTETEYIADGYDALHNDLPEKEFPVIQYQAEHNEGLAAEYYHACAVEQLTSVTYFECCNHSCSQRLPILVNTTLVPEQAKGGPTPDVHSRGVAMLGSPFDDEKVKQNLPVVHSHPELAEDDDASTTDFESDAESERFVSSEKEQSKAKVSTAKTPIDSDSDEEPDELSPNIRKANTAAIVRARALTTGEVKRVNTAASVSRDIPNIASVVPRAAPEEIRSKTPAQAQSILEVEKPMPALPLSPSIRHQPGQIQRSETASQAPGQHTPHAKPFLLSQQFFSNSQGKFVGLPATPTAKRAYAPLGDHSQERALDLEKAVDRPSINKRGKSKTRLVDMLKGLWSGRSKKNGGTSDEKKKSKKRKCALCICLLLLLVVILCIVLATTLVRKGDNTPIGSRWLNLTGYPPMPTGISTIAQPELAQSKNQCVQPSTLWSCSLPKDDQSSSASNVGEISDFRFEIKYRNGTTPANMNIPLNKRANDPVTNDLYTANPNPPSEADQLFLGNTTDNVTAPFNGEVTPFYISFMPTYPVVPSSLNISSDILNKRQSNLGLNIPAPSSLSDGTATPAALLPTNPYPGSQPVKLYNRGHPDEHYGFYIYYDKSIFLSSISIVNGNSTVDNSAASQNADSNGGSTKANANVRCTWQQTRFLVKIFTNAKFGGELLSSGSRNGTTSATAMDTSKQSEYNSATDFAKPGSFPYPTSIVLDRHGGSINTKITYCYGMDKGIIDESQKQLVLEDRSAGGGNIINGAPSFVNSGNGSSNRNFDPSAGGIDGGTGGCQCTWQNWI